MDLTRPVIVRTLLGAGFRITRSFTGPNYLGVLTNRDDEFGALSQRLFAFVEKELSAADVRALQQVSQRERVPLIVVGDCADTPNAETIVVTPDEFMGRLGGSISSFLPLEDSFGDHLSELGLNRLPTGLTGKADDLFELYAKQGLEFILQDRVIRYGQERLFEALPDGIVTGRRSPVLLYDCKAAEDGYDITSNTIRQFASYVDDFHHRYESFLGRAYAFVAISGFFQSPDTLESRSSELYAKCGVKLCFLDSTNFSAIVSMFAERPAYRQSIDWNHIFAQTVIESAMVKRNLDARLKDKVIPAK